MKYLYFLFVSMLCVTPVLSQKTDEEAIKKVIESENAAFLAGNADKVRSYYSFKPYAWGTVTFANGVSLHETGEAFSKFYDRIKPNPNVTAKHTDYVFKINGNQGWVTNLNTQTNKIDNSSTQSHQLRCLEKVNDVWKIVALSSHPIKKDGGVTPQMDEEAIKKVIISETEHWLDQDVEAWSNSFVQAPYLTWTVTNGSDPGDGLTVRGWEGLKDFMKGWFAKDQSAFVKEMRKSKMTRDQWQIQIRGNVAWVSYNQKSEDAKQMVNSTETRVLERINGVWKVAMQATVADFKDAVPPIRSKY